MAALELVAACDADADVDVLADVDEEEALVDEDDTEETGRVVPEAVPVAAVVEAPVAVDAPVVTTSTFN